MIVNPGKFLASAVGSLTQPLFNKGQIMAQYRIAKAQQEEASLSFQQALLNAGSEVNDALVACQTSKAKTLLFEKQIQSLEKALESTSLLMEHGTTTIIWKCRSICQRLHLLQQRIPYRRFQDHSWTEWRSSRLQVIQKTRNFILQ